MLKEFETKAIALLTVGLFSYADLSAISREAELISLEHTGAGYFLTIKHPRFRRERIVFSDPVVIGKIPGLVVGFVVFIEDAELTLECHGFGADSVPKDIRERDVQVDPARIENGEIIKF
jgi:hypothetical protein